MDIETRKEFEKIQKQIETLTKSNNMLKGKVGELGNELRKIKKDYVARDDMLKNLIATSKHI